MGYGLWPGAAWRTDHLFNFHGYPRCDGSIFREVRWFLLKDGFGCAQGSAMLDVWINPMSWTISPSSNRHTSSAETVAAVPLRGRVCESLCQFRRLEVVAGILKTLIPSPSLYMLHEESMLALRSYQANGGHSLIQQSFFCYPRDRDLYIFFPSDLRTERNCASSNGGSE